MAAQIPIKNDEAANKKAMEGVYADKLREVTAGHDGTWVAHPALAKIAYETFNKHMPTPNQIFKRREDVNITGMDLLNMNMPGSVTEAGIRKNLVIGRSGETNLRARNLGGGGVLHQPVDGHASNGAEPSLHVAQTDNQVSRSQVCFSAPTCTAGC